MALLYTEIVEKLKEYLISHGYPEKSIVTEYKVGMFRVDLAVIDLTTNLPAQIFEIKARDEKKGRDFLKRIDQELKYSDVLYYLVFPSNNQIGIKIKSLDDIKEAGEFIPNYKDNVNRVQNAKIDKYNKETKDAISKLKTVSWAFAFICLLILYIDVRCEKIITMERIYTMLATFVLIMLPFFHNIKIFGMELSSLKDIRKNDSEN